MRSNKGVETSTKKTHAIEAYSRVSKLIDEGRKVRSLFPIAAAFVIFGCATTSAQNAVPPNIANAVANQDRPDEDRQRDADRKPAEVLTFVGVKNGEEVADFIPGTGYFSRILSSAVGPQGHVYGFFPSELANFIKRPLPPNGSTPYLEFKNVSVIAVPVNDFAAPKPLDLVWISLNYHDLHDPFFAPADVAKINKAVFAALKPVEVTSSSITLRQPAPVCATPTHCIGSMRPRSSRKLKLLASGWRARVTCFTMGAILEPPT